MSVDPLFHSYPWYTPYQYAGNKPIRFIDLDGLEEDEPIAFQWANASTNTFIRFFQLDKFLIGQKLKNEGLELADDELIESFSIRMRTVAVGEPYFSMESGSWMQDHERQFVIEPKNSFGWEVLEAATDIFTLVPQGGSKGRMPGVAFANGSKATAYNIQSFMKLMREARQFENNVLIAASDKYKKVQRQVSLKLKDGTTARFDGVGEDGEMFTIIEAKMGQGKLSSNQRAVLNALNDGEDVIAVGFNSSEIFGKSNVGKSITDRLNKAIDLNNVTEPIDNVLKTI